MENKIKIGEPYQEKEPGGGYISLHGYRLVCKR